ncbi:MAG: (d)CMP kinase [Bacillota bacterium]|uniref:Cytidylate kinase n=1 Tax=[Clostridium] aminophilum TaxID=1526 RepID=A0A1I6IJQ2_9FIRM|nr:(d)CMP kinase [[Clostridium] aminophilum]MCR4628908.1 (d)CMP kinase [Clostridium sp.]MDT3844929.1 (d)CMP kinase [Bacillota bacterium]SFR66530.1 cytidylate kinase [[Clostridium] aminophilum]
MSISIAIDGPAGAGKSTIAKKLAEKMNYIYVDTGAMYRTIALFFLQKGVSGDDAGTIASMVDDIDIAITYEDGVQQLFLNGVNVTGQIRTAEVSRMASQTSAHGPVRKKLVELQRKIASENNVIMDGRDIGTAVLPNAEVKIYLTASSRVRAERRYREFLEKGTDMTLDEVEKEIIERDHQDMTRAISPLVQAEDAVLVDSSDMTLEEVIETIETIVADRGEKIGR